MPRFPGVALVSLAYPRLFSQHASGVQDTCSAGCARFTRLPLAILPSRLRRELKTVDTRFERESVVQKADRPGRRLQPAQLPCSANRQAEETPAGTAPFCLVTPYSKKCIYEDAPTCRMAASMERSAFIQNGEPGVCVENPNR